jgi:hypothetical protein
MKPVRDGNNRPYSGGGNIYFVPTSETANLYIGDSVIINGSADTNGVPSVIKATAGTSNRITGVITGWVPNPSIVANGYRVTATAAYAIVEDDPNVMYEVQATTAAVTDVGANINLAAATGSRLTQSATYANGAQIGTGATYQLRILGFAQRPDSETGAYAKLLVRINLPTEAGIASGVGV